MKKLLPLALIIVLAITLFTGCSPEAEVPDDGEGLTQVEELLVYFVPSREPEEIITQTEPLKGMLTEELAELGFEVGDVDIKVGTTYEAVGEALSAGSAHVGLIPANTYVLYDDGAEVILTATRAGLNKDSENPADWNDGEPTLPIEEQVTYYRSLLVAGTTEKGQAAIEKVNNGEMLSLEEIKDLTWGVRGTTSGAGYVYPSLWLNEHYGVLLSDLPNVVQLDSYATSLARLASEGVDVVSIYADARRDYGEQWAGDWGKENIWTETGVIGVSSGIYNDTVSVTADKTVVSDELQEAIAQAFINIAQSEEGLAVIDIYAHEGYVPATSEDYDLTRQAQDILKNN